MLLIIGGRYGSLASAQNKDNYEKQYISITRKEYETAKEKGIPVMIFVEQNVYTEYRTYQTNKESLPKNFKFAYVDDVKIFEFIASLEQNAIKSFNKVDDIEHYFTYQISGMLLSYLTQLQTERTTAAIKTAVEQINVASKSMQTMINSIAEKVLEGEKDKYQELLLQQNKSLIDFFIELVDQNIKFNNNGAKIQEKDVEKLAVQICKALNNKLFNKQIFIPIYEEKDIEARFSAYRRIMAECAQEIENIRNGLILEINIFGFDTQLAHIFDLITQNRELQQYFNDQILKEIQFEIDILV